jgi:hypothetical protein
MIRQKIIDHGFAQTLKELDKLGHYFTKVGFPERGEAKEATRKGSGHEIGTDISQIIQVVAVHEFGAPNKNIPERAFVRPSFDENYQALQEFKRLQWKLVTKGNQTAETGIKKIGEWMTARTKRKIQTGHFEPLKEATIKRKGSARPLIDTAQMINSVQHVEEYRK